MDKTSEQISEKIENSEQYVIEAKDVYKIYKLGSVEVKALRGVNFKVKKGEIVSIMGSSGSGKTSLLNLLGGLDAPSSGVVLLDNSDIGKMSDKELTMVRRYKIGFIFQTYNLLPVLSAYENVELPMLIAGLDGEKRKERVMELLEIVGLGDRIKHKPDELSGGQKQRVAIARALANNPSVLLCDEPTGDLDSETGSKIMELFEKINKDEKQTIIIVTHDKSVAKRTEKTFYINDGNIERIEIHNSKE